MSTCALPSWLQVHIVDLWKEHTKYPFSSMPDSYSFLVKHAILWRLSYEVSQPRWFHIPYLHICGMLCAKGVSDALDLYQPDLLVRNLLPPSLTTPAFSYEVAPHSTNSHHPYHPCVQLACLPAPRCMPSCGCDPSKGQAPCFHHQAHPPRLFTATAVGSVRLVLELWPWACLSAYQPAPKEQRHRTGPLAAWGSIKGVAAEAACAVRAVQVSVHPLMQHIPLAVIKQRARYGPCSPTTHPAFQLPHQPSPPCLLPSLRCTTCSGAGRRVLSSLLHLSVSHSARVRSPAEHTP